MRRHLMPLAAFFMQTEPPALALGVVVLRPQGPDAGNDRAHQKTQFHLPAERTEIQSDFHFQSTETPNVL
jgi:hypothetical protein